MKTNRRQFLVSTAVLAAMSATMGTLLPDPAFAQTAKTRDLSASTAQIDAYMGAPVEMAKAENGAITHKRKTQDSWNWWKW